MSGTAAKTPKPRSRRFQREDVDAGALNQVCPKGGAARSGLADAIAAVVLFKVARPKSEHLLLTVQMFRGAPRLDFRLWYPDRDGCLQPGSKGFTIPYENVGMLSKALSSAKAMLAVRLTAPAND